MKILVTAGNTLVPIDQVRVITNIFKGKTGTEIAGFMAHSGAEVTLVASNPEIVPEIEALKIIPYRTFSDLREIMQREITKGNYDVIIHSAAVSDYSVGNVLIKGADGQLQTIDSGGKVSSNYPTLYLELPSTEKLIDKIRSDWGFTGTLVKFKLEVGKSYEELLSIAMASVHASKADLIVANCLEWYGKFAIIVDPDGTHSEVDRSDLPKELWRAINEKDSLRNYRECGCYACYKTCAKHR